MKVSLCPRCGADGIHTGDTPLPDGNGHMEQYKCLNCGHGYLLSPEGAARPAEQPVSDRVKCAAVI